MPTPPRQHLHRQPQAMLGLSRWQYHRPRSLWHWLRRRRRPCRRRARHRPSLLMRPLLSTCSYHGGGRGRCRPCGRCRRACRANGPAGRPVRCAPRASLSRVSAHAAPSALLARLRSPTATTTWPAAGASGSACAARAGVCARDTAGGDYSLSWRTACWRARFCQRMCVPRSVRMRRAALGMCSCAMTLRHARRSCHGLATA